MQILRDEVQRPPFARAEFVPEESDTRRQTFTGKVKEGLCIIMSGWIRSGALMTARVLDSKERISVRWKHSGDEEDVPGDIRDLKSRGQ